MKTKYLVLGGLAILAGTLTYGAKNGLDVQSVAQQLKIRLKQIRNLDILGSGLNLELDIDVTNPTDIPLDVSTGGLITISKIYVNDNKGNLIATAEPNITNISIPANGTITLRQVPVRSSFGSILDTLLSGGTDIKNYTVQTEIQAVGTTFLV